MELVKWLTFPNERKTLESFVTPELNPLPSAASPYSGEVIRTERLSLRWLEPRDFPSLLSMFNDPIVMKYYPKMLNEEETLAWMGRVFEGYKNYGHSFYGVELIETGQVIGQIGLLPQIVEGNYRTELGYLLKSEYFGKGFATEAGRTCLEYGFRKLGADVIISLIRPENTPSRAVAKRLGLEVEKEIEWKGHPSLVHSITKATFEKNARQ